MDMIIMGVLIAIGFYLAPVVIAFVLGAIALIGGAIVMILEQLFGRRK
jgi:hypothetical protein